MPLTSLLERASCLLSLHASCVVCLLHTGLSMSSCVPFIFSRVFMFSNGILRSSHAGPHKMLGKPLW